MNASNTLPLLILCGSLIPGLIIFCLNENQRRLRTVLNLSGAITTVALIGVLLVGVYQGAIFETRLPLLPSIDLVLHVDALSLLFVSLSGVLWLVTTVYAIGYLEDSPHRNRFFGFFSLCVCATLGIALAGNLITFLIFYELLTLTTYPLIVHRGTAVSIRAGRIYLTYTMIGGALLLAAVVWLKALGGPLDFTATDTLGSVPGLDHNHLMLIFALLIAGLGVKAALVPWHGWLPVAMAAPAPVSALLHAVAVVKAGAFGIVRVVYDVYGIEFARDLGLTDILAVMAAITIIYGSVCALFQNDLKKRLAYSTVSQVSYIALGTAIAGPIATIGGIVHLVHQGLMKITLFFCAGNMAETLGIHKISEMAGVGRRMPWTMAAFSIAALGMIGIPPMAGFVSKWYLGVGAIEAGAQWVLVVLVGSSLLNAIYLLPVLFTAWFKTPVGDWPAERNFGNNNSRWETHWMLLLPPLVTATLSLMTGLAAGWVASPLNWAKLIAAREGEIDIAQSLQSIELVMPVLWMVILTPLLFAAALVVFRQSRWIVALTPWAALPALLIALLPYGADHVISWLFFGSILGLDDVGRGFLLLAALLWFAAGLYAQHYLATTHNPIRFFLFFLLAMSGNFGLILAQDVFGFITFFTLMSLAAYGLIIHDGSQEALRAGKTYMQWVIMGEVILFTCLTWLVHSGGTADLRELGSLVQPGWITALIIAGFGIKAGLLTLHVWLPRAHPVAPVPASALLSGIMVKAGLLGWLRFLPLNVPAAAAVSYQGWGLVLIALGLAAALLAIIPGLLQRNPKTVLAYSTISQMGIITTGVGTALVDPSLLPVLMPALLLYAIHHGLAKGALFLSTGLVPFLGVNNRPRWWLWVAVLVPAVALAGLPFSSGLLAKVALKSAVTDLVWLAAILPITAIATTLLMARFIDLLIGAAITKTTHQVVSPVLILPYLLLCFAVVATVYLMPQAQPFLYLLLLPETLLTATWPPLLGLLLYLIGRKQLATAPLVPAGDVLIAMEWGMARCQRFVAATSFLAVQSYRTLYTYSLRNVFFLGNEASQGLLMYWRRTLMYWRYPGLAFIAVMLAVAVLTAMQRVL